MAASDFRADNCNNDSRPAVYYTSVSNQDGFAQSAPANSKCHSQTWWEPLHHLLLVKPRQIPKRIAIYSAIAIAVSIWLLYRFGSAPEVHMTTNILGITSLAKPHGFKIIGVVFYGRRATVEILECYLRTNLASHGGFLDAVHFVINTEDEGDVEWIEKMTDSVEGYEKIYMEAGADPRDYEVVWREALEPGHMYIKFDDDLVWMSDSAVVETVYTLIEHPEAFVVLANLVNSAALGWLHLRQGAFHSYLPELSPPIDPGKASYGPTAWRASSLPTYETTDGSPAIPFPDTDKDFAGSRAEIGSVGGPPYANHRWLPLRDAEVNLSLTPIWDTEYHPNGNNWRRWALGAQQHYSLLENIETGDLWRYHFGADGVWNMHYEHANINFMAVWADDILANLPFDVAEDDEAHFTMHLPRKLGRQTLIQSRAIASHFSFGPQREMYDTDLLSRYRAYANEMVCGKMNQIPVTEG